jgi:hypothetical protein
MSDSHSERWGPWAGIAFAVLFVAGLLLNNLPSGDDSLAKIVSFYNDKGNRAQLIISSYLLFLAGLFFFWFLAGLRVRLLEAEGAPGRLTSIAFGGGLVFVSSLMVAAACFMTAAANVTFGDEKFVAADAARILPELGYPVLVIGGIFAAIAMIDAASVLIMRTGLWPRWLAYYGFVAAVVLLASFLFAPMILFVLWVIFVSVAMLRAAPKQEVLQPPV